MLIDRILKKDITKYFWDIPVTAIIGARQVGKSTLAKHIISNQDNAIYLDLETRADLQMLEDPIAFLSNNKSNLICIDEIQFKPDLFKELRSFIDNNPSTKFLILGSSSPELMRQSSENLAGRIFYYELSAFLYPEMKHQISQEKYLLRGGFPLSCLAKNDELAFLWLNNYIKTFLERDLRTFGYNIPPATLNRLWQMLAHINGQILNYSLLANSMGLSQPTVKQYIDVLKNTFMIRTLQPYYINIKKRVIKTPKLFFRDTGVLHALLNINSYDQLFAHPIYGHSWEALVIENIINVFNNWDHFYYRTAKGNELDLVLQKGNRIIAIEIKSSSTPSVGKGFWRACEDIQATEQYLIAPVPRAFIMHNNLKVMTLNDFLENFN